MTMNLFLSGILAMCLWAHHANGQEIRDWERVPISLRVEQCSLEDVCQAIVQQVDRERSSDRDRLVVAIANEDPDSGWTFQSPRLTITCTNANAGEIVSLLGEMTDMRIVRLPNHVLFKPKGMGDGLRTNVVWTILSPTPCDEDAPDNIPPFYLFGAGAQAQPPPPNPEASP